MEIAIYVRLLDRCRSLAWKNPFGFKCDDLRSKVRSTNSDSKKAFDTARNKLKQAGLIDFKNGNGRGIATIYTIKGLLKGAQHAHLSAPLSEPLLGSSGGYITTTLPTESSDTTSSGLPPVDSEKQVAWIANYLKQCVGDKLPDTDARKEAVKLLKKYPEPVPALMTAWANNLKRDREHATSALKSGSKNGLDKKLNDQIFG